MTGNGTPGERRNSLEAWIVQRFGGPDAKDGLAKHAEKLVLQAGELRAPVRLAKIAQGMGLDPHPIYKPNALDGALKIIDGSLRIVLRHNRSTPPSATSHQYPRLRFSYAHEMSHALFYELGRKPQIRIAPQENYRAEEQLCNFAASRFLIPTFLLQQEVTGIRDLSPELFCTLSKTFQVSLQTIIYRVGQAVLDQLETNRFYMVSSICTAARGLGVEKPRCIRCFIPKAVAEKGIVFLHSFQGIDRVRKEASSGGAWSLEEYFSRAMHRSSAGKVDAEETLRCPNGRVLRLKISHQTIGHGPLVWSVGTIRSIREL